MKLRIRFSKYLLHLGDFLQTLPTVYMKPDDLTEFSRQTYAEKRIIDAFSDDTLVESGLSFDETELLKSIPFSQGRLLILGVGGGREAIAFGKMGFHITGVDFIHELVDRAITISLNHNVQINGLVQEISKIEVPNNSYDIAWLSKGMYSCVPTRARRIEMVQRIYNALRPGGFFLCQFQNNFCDQYPGNGDKFRYFLSRCPLGNQTYEKGDILWAKREFLHIFSSEDEVKKELEEGGVLVKSLIIDSSKIRGGAICQKAN